jgi:hypothetical protein
VSVPSIVLRFELQNVEPCIWRIVRMPSDLTLVDLHAVVQTVMGWDDRHPHAFEIEDRTPVTAKRTAKTCSGACATVDESRTITETLDASHDSFLYRYDAQANWRVRITRAPGVWRGKRKSPVACIDGYLAGPRDDGRGPAAYNAILAATLGRGPRLTEQQIASLGPKFDPESFDRCAVNRALAAIGNCADVAQPVATAAG